MRPALAEHWAFALQFQSTHPVWGATKGGVNADRLKAISIHAPRVGCDAFLDFAHGLGVISIHAPRVGCDTVPLGMRLG